MSNIRILLLLFFCWLFTESCNYIRDKPDVSDINVDIKIQRFEIDLFSYPKDSSVALLPNILSNKYGIFWKIYAGNIMQLGNPEDEAQIATTLDRFISDQSMNELYFDCIKKYPELSTQEAELNTAFKYYKYYFPEKSIPKVISFVSGFSMSIASLDSTIGIGLDMYLGSDYNRYPFPEFQKKRMTPENIVPDCMYSWISTEYEFKSDKDDLLSNMIYVGKMMYLMDLLLPDKEDSIKIAYTKNQIDWCKKNEKDVWKYFVGNNLLYSTDKMQFYKKYFSEAPFTSGFPQDSPGKICVWLGWQIVKSYMQNQSEANISELINQNDAQLILKESKYKP